MLIIAGTSISNLTFLAVVIVNTAIGIIQELRAKKTLEKLSLISAPVTKVIRDGHEDSINSDELVLDDIVIFEAGNQICADAILCDGEITVNANSFFPAALSFPEDAARGSIRSDTSHLPPV